MKPAQTNPNPVEIELKLALPAADPSGLAKRLARVPVLARRESTRLHLHNIYYDTPEQRLRQQRVALRIRRIGSDARPQWVQTLKTAGQGDSALSQRGEWETPVPNAKLSIKALKATPWADLFPGDDVFKTLKPCFETNFERTCWLVRRRDGSEVEVALDIGQVVAGGNTMPICELELELKAGQPEALFDVARQIANSISVLPASMSKAERGFALAQGAVDQPLYAKSQVLTAKIPVQEAAQCVMREMFSQFTTNLNALRRSDDPELVHQARVGWRRFKSASRLFSPVLAAELVPSWLPLQTLLICLGELRDLDVARTETLPSFAEAFVAGDARRAQAWQDMTVALTDAADLQRKSVRYALMEPAVGAALLAGTQWLESLSAQKESTLACHDSKTSFQQWAKRRIQRWHETLKLSLKDAGRPEKQHRVRILAKRTRYCIEALQLLLPKKQADRWHRQATSLQANLGMERDIQRAGTLMAGLDVDRGLVEFMRGFAMGQQWPQK